MTVRRIPQSRAERLIAIGRFVLAIASFAAIYFDPLEPSRFPTLTYSMLAVYAVYSLLTVLWTVAAPETSRRAQVTSHLLDLTFFGAINHLTFGPTSPFFTYFVFSIVCAMLRFGRRGTILTALAAMVVYIASSLGRVNEVEFELNRFIIRSAYLAVVASMLIYLSAYQERIQRDLARVARWPRSRRTDAADLVANLLGEATSIFGSRRALLAYELLGERFVYLSSWNEDGLAVTAEPEETARLLLDHDSGTYVRAGASQTASIDFDDSASITRVAPAAPQPPSERGLKPQLVQRYGIGAVVATSFQGDFVRGRLLLLDGPLPLLEEVNLARIAGSVIAGRLDHYHAAEQLQRGAVAEERVRVARDLHDSVLQSLTGVALQLRTLPRLIPQNPDEAQKRFAEIEQVIVATQKELRWFIDELRPDRRNKAESGLGERLVSLAQRFREQWGLEVENQVAPVVHLLPISTRYEIYAIVNEGVANAAKHAAAKRVTVAINVENGDVRIDVADDGRGFPFHGRYDLQSLVETKRGPVTLKERVSSLGGSMFIDSSSAGARLEIRLPLRAGAGA
jgi:signal transduction histidine kinase